MKRARLLPLVALSALLTACGSDPEPTQYGPDPQLPEPQRGLLPDMKIANPAEWGDQRPDGAARLRDRGDRHRSSDPAPDPRPAQWRHPGCRRQRRRGAEPDAEGRDCRLHQGEGDKPGHRRQPPDLAAGQRWRRHLRSGRSSPTISTRLTGSRWSAASSTSPIRMRWCVSTTAMGRPGQADRRSRSRTCLRQINHHWTKALAASADGRFLYVGIGSNSNITERGMPAEADRAMVWQVDAQTGAHRPYATGLRNPTALAIQPGTGQLWAVVNERDEIGPNLVPDYLTAVREGGFYGWPYSYWGQNVDTRVRPAGSAKGRRRQSAPITAWDLMSPRSGVAFSAPAMGAQFAEGVFVGEHGSWNRSVPVGYKVSLRAVPRRPPGRSAGRLRHRLPRDGRQDSRAAGRSDRGSARRVDRRRRPFEHHLARNPPKGSHTRRCGRGAATALTSAPGGIFRVRAHHHRGDAPQHHPEGK